MMDSLIDWFGKTFKILKHQDGKLEILLKCNESAIKYWALQYGDYVEILAPQSLRDSIAESVRGMYGLYCKEREE